jgi:hypothetical protein
LCKSAVVDRRGRVAEGRDAQSASVFLPGRQCGGMDREISMLESVLWKLKVCRHMLAGRQISITGWESILVCCGHLISQHKLLTNLLLSHPSMYHPSFHYRTSLYPTSPSLHYACLPNLVYLCMMSFMNILASIKHRIKWPREYQLLELGFLHVVQWLKKLSACFDIFHYL